MTLGEALKRARNRAGLSLRDTERLIGISNGYLSLLESDKVKTPSPKYLHKLSEAFETSYSLLMELAGYTVPTINAWPDEFDDLTTSEVAQVRSFAHFLRQSRGDSGNEPE